MVTLLIVPAAVSEAIAEATTIEALASISQSIPASVFTGGNRTPLDAAGAFECLTRALEVIEAASASEPSRRVVRRHLDALVSGSRAHGMIAGDAPRARTWAPGHAWNPIASGSLGGILSNVYDVQREYNRAAEGISETGRKSLKALLYSLDSVIKAVVYRRETVDIDGWDDAPTSETF